MGQHWFSICDVQKCLTLDTYFITCNKKLLTLKIYRTPHATYSHFCDKLTSCKLWVNHKPSHKHSIIPLNSSLLVTNRNLREKPLVSSKLLESSRLMHRSNNYALEHMVQRVYGPFVTTLFVSAICIPPKISAYSTHIQQNIIWAQYSHFHRFVRPLSVTIQLWKVSGF